MKIVEILQNGIIKDNPVFRLLLGMCPILAVTTTAMNGLGMGLASMFVLFGSNTVISLLRNQIPNRVRIPAYITVIAGFVTIVQLLVKAYFPALDSALGIFIPLIVVNCILLARAEAFASKNSVGYAIVDAIGTGIGFTLALVLIGSFREILGSGSFFGWQFWPDRIETIAVMILPPGGFLALGILLSIFNKLSKTQSPINNCQSCPMDCSVKKCKQEEATQTS